MMKETKKEKQDRKFEKALEAGAKVEKDSRTQKRMTAS